MCANDRFEHAQTFIKAHRTAKAVIWQNIQAEFENVHQLQKPNTAVHSYLAHPALKSWMLVYNRAVRQIFFHGLIFCISGVFNCLDTYSTLFFALAPKPSDSKKPRKKMFSEAQLWLVISWQKQHFLLKQVRNLSMPNYLQKI